MWELDDKQPANSALKTVEKRAVRLMEWKNDVEVFLGELEECKSIMGVGLMERKRG